MKRNGSSQNCQVKSTRLKTVLSQVCFLAFPSLEIAISFSSAVRYQALRCAGRFGMKNQPLRPDQYNGSFRLFTGLTKEGNWNGRDRDDDKDKTPSWKTFFARQRFQQTCLDPSASHISQISEAAKDCSSRAQFGFLVPRAIYEMCSNAGSSQCCFVSTLLKSSTRLTMRWLKVHLRKHSR